MERVTECLSRLIDGELDPASREELEAALESDRALRRELDGLIRVRTSLRSLADREHPPAELGALVDPLLRGKPEAAFARPWVRWMAAAAVVVLGVTVVLEVQRRQPDAAIHSWQKRVLEGAAAEPTERFSLAPLPTSSVPAEDQPLGAADRLVSAPEPEVEPALDPAPALEVLGPLQTGAVSEEMRDVGEDLDAAVVKSRKRDEPDRPPSQTEHPSQASEPPLERAKSPPPAAQLQSAPSGGGTRGSGTESAEITTPGAQLFVFMEATTAWRSFQPDGPCEAGRYALRIRVEGGVIREVWPVANPPAPTRQVRASQLVLGLDVKDVADGEYAAEVVVEPRYLPNR